MNVVIAIDSFKGSMTSLEAGEAAADGIRRVIPEADICVRPLADGGEGTVETLTIGMGGQKQYLSVTGPLGEPVNCVYGYIETKQTAVIEMSAAAGITLVPREQLNPLEATTYGVGEIIRDAILKGCRQFIIGIGGSATNDGGIGMLSALGYEFIDENGQPVSRGAKGLEQLSDIKLEHVLPQLSECTFKIACDVDNVLCGPKGCSAIYGPQKGATPEMIEKMDIWLGRYARLARKHFWQANPEYPGTGAAGGLGFAFLTFTQAVLEPGVKLVIEEIGLEKDICNADIVITGEGRLDGQSAMGKAPVGVARLAKKHGKFVLAFAGAVTKDAVLCHEQGIDAYFPIVRGVTTLTEAMASCGAKRNMSDAVEQVFRALLTWQCR